MALSVDFSFTPVSATPLSFTVGGNTYPYVHQVDAVTRASDSRYAASLTTSNTAMTFTASTVASQGTTAIEYRWDFGDGTIAYGPIVTHTYVAASPQTAVSLVVTDQNLVQWTRQKLLNLRAGTKIVFGLPFRVTG